MAKNNKDKKGNKGGPSVLRYSGLGLQIAVIIGGGSYLGSWLDEQFPSDKKWYTLLFVLASTALAIYYAIKELNKINSN